MSTQLATWQCPIHGAAKVRQGQHGFYCSVLVGVGQPNANAKGYCIHGAKFAAPAAPVPAPYPTAPVPAPVAPAPVVGNGHPDPLPAFPSDAQIAAAALNFAATIYHLLPSDVPTAEEAISVAVKAFRAMKGIMS